MSKEREMLREHGTELMKLKPATIVQAAQADLKRKLRNAETGKLAFGCEGYEHYAFHRRHVRRAVDVVDLLVRALMEPGPGLASAKYNTRLLYGDGGLILAAIKLARGDDENLSG